MYCTQCGSQIADGSAFCPYCGASLANAQPVQAQQAPEQTYAAPEQTYAAPEQGSYQQPQFAQQPYGQAGYQQPYDMPGYNPGNPMGYVQAPPQANPAPSFGECIKLFFKNYVNFSGRSRRAEYWYVVLFETLVSVVLSALSGVLASVTDGSTVVTVITSILTYGFSLAVLIPGIALVIRRLHDIGKSGFYLFISLIPLVGSIILIVWCAKDSSPEPNQYGVSPKYTPGYSYEQAPSQQPPVPPVY